MNENLNSRRRILITGITGFVGAALRTFFVKKGYEVWGISRNISSDKHILQADLQNFEQVVLALKKMPKFSTVIHAAALINNDKKKRGDSFMHMNPAMTRHLIEAVIDRQPVFIFLSSVSVYGEANRILPISVEDEVRPGSEYGRSKLECEEVVRKSGLKHFHILRPAPVYDETHPMNIKKRVFFPFQEKFKMVLLPSPSYSFCHIDVLLNTALNLLDHQTKENMVYNVTDSLPCRQNELAARFEGINIYVPLALTKLFYLLTFLMPKTYRYAVQCLYCKLFKSNIYA